MVKSSCPFFTSEPSAKSSVQSLPQLMPAGSLTIFPLPTFDRFNRNRSVGVGEGSSSLGCTVMFAVATFEAGYATPSSA